MGALASNTTGNANTASGWTALKSATTSSGNTATGYGALTFNTTGDQNTASGGLALFYNATGSNNTALGFLAGPDSNSTNLVYAAAIGAGAVVSQSNSLVLGGPLGSGAQVKVGIGTATPANVFTIAHGAGQAIADGWATYSCQGRRKREPVWRSKSRRAMSNDISGTTSSEHSSHSRTKPAPYDCGL